MDRWIRRTTVGRALAAGVAGDQPRIDDELLFLRAADDLDVPHIRLLAKVQEQASGQAWNIDIIGILDPGLGESAQPVLNTLAAYGWYSQAPMS